MKVANTYWDRLQARDRPHATVATNASAKKRRATTSSSAGTVEAQVRETLAARTSVEVAEQEAADRLKVTPNRKLFSAALSGSKVAIKRLADAEQRRRGRKISQEAHCRHVGDVEAETAEWIADTGDQAL